MVSWLISWLFSDCLLVVCIHAHKNTGTDDKATPKPPETRMFCPRLVPKNAVFYTETARHLFWVKRPNPPFFRHGNVPEESPMVPSQRARSRPPCASLGCPQRIRVHSPFGVYMPGKGQLWLPGVRSHQLLVQLRMVDMDLEVVQLTPVILKGWLVIK